MIWTNKGLRERVAELEVLVSSLNVELSDEKLVAEARAELCDSQHERIKSLLREVESLKETSSNVVVPLVKEDKSSLTPGQKIALRLRGKEV